jgi:hypothetical protein
VLAKKLNLKAGMRVAIVNAPAKFSLGAAPGVVVEQSLKRGLDAVLAFAVTQKELALAWRKAIASTKESGAICIAYPKKSSGVATDIAGMQEWDVTKGSDWHPVSLVSVDATWSAIRYKYAPGLEEQRHQRQSERIKDADGTVCVDRTQRIVTAPRDLQRAIAKSGVARTAFDALSFTHRKEYVVWILDAKKPETRAGRVEKTVAMLAAGKKNRSGT